MRRHSQTPQMWSIRQNVSTGQEGNAAEKKREYDFLSQQITDMQVEAFWQLRG